MITPLMAILTGVDTKTLDVSTPLDFTYLSSSDLYAFNKAVSHIGNIVSDEDTIYIDDTYHTSTYQLVNNELSEIHPYTGIVIDVLRECYSKWEHKNSVDTISDLSSDDLLVRIGHNPYSIYWIVYSIMRGNLNKSYESRVQILQSILDAVEHSNGKVQLNGLSQNDCSKLIELSTVSFWQKLLYTKYVDLYGSLPETVTSDTMTTISNELNQLGLHGFVNPHLMYLKFKGSRMVSQSIITIPDEILKYLRHCVRSGIR